MLGATGFLNDFVKDEVKCRGLSVEDFGAEIDNEKSVLFAGRKSGHVYALDPDNQGKLLWVKRIVHIVLPWVYEVKTKPLHLAHQNQLSTKNHCFDEMDTHNLHDE